MTLQQTPSSPLISNDWLGLGRLVFVLVLTVLAPIATFVILWMRKGPADEINRMRGSIRDFGERVGGVEQKREGDRETVEELKRKMELSGQDRLRLRDDVNRLGGRMDGYEKQTLEQQRDTMTAITSSGQAIQQSIHALDLRVTRMDERANFAEQICDGFRDMGEKIVGAMTAREERELRERRERDGQRRDG